MIRQWSESQDKSGNWRILHNPKYPLTFKLQLPLENGHLGKDHVLIVSTELLRK